MSTSSGGKEVTRVFGLRSKIGKGGLCHAGGRERRGGGKWDAAE